MVKMAPTVWILYPAESKRRLLDIFPILAANQKATLLAPHSEMRVPRTASNTSSILEGSASLITFFFESCFFYFSCSTLTFPLAQVLVVVHLSAFHPCPKQHHRYEEVKWPLPSPSSVFVFSCCIALVTPENMKCSGIFFRVVIFVMYD